MQTTRPDRDRTDEELVDQLVEWVVQVRSMPSSNRVIADCGVGRGRSKKLLRLLADRPEVTQQIVDTPEDWTGAASNRTEPGRAKETGPDREVAQSSAPTSSGPQLDHNWTGHPRAAVSDRTISGPPAAAEVSVQQATRTENESQPSDWSTLTGTIGPVQVGPNQELAETAETVADAGRSTDRHRMLLTGLYLIAASAGVAIWSGWVGLGGLAGFGPVHPLPGIADRWTINAAVALPLGMEAFAAIALKVWISGGHGQRARQYAKRSTLAALITGAGGQVAYHLLVAFHATAAPWEIVTFVAILPVAVLGMAAGLAHLVLADSRARKGEK